jgi:predicted aspartyl protease
MIHGVINFRYELTLSLVVGNSNGQREFTHTVIDTGFDGFLSLPSEVIVRLGLLHWHRHLGWSIPHDRYC